MSHALAKFLLMVVIKIASRQKTAFEISDADGQQKDYLILGTQGFRNVAASDFGGGNADSFADQ